MVSANYFQDSFGPFLYPIRMQDSSEEYTVNVNKIILLKISILLFKCTLTLLFDDSK